MGEIFFMTEMFILEQSALSVRGSCFFSTKISTAGMWCQYLPRPRFLFSTVIESLTDVAASSSTETLYYYYYFE